MRCWRPTLSSLLMGHHFTGQISRSLKVITIIAPVGDETEVGILVASDLIIIQCHAVIMGASSLAVTTLL